MKLIQSRIRLSATDLSNHLSCRHLTTLDLQVAQGEREAPDWAAPHAVVIRELGERHEKAYLRHLLERGVLYLASLESIKSETEGIQETARLMEQGVDVIAQGALADGHWFGRPDVLMRVSKPSPKWAWSYEVVDTKLALETKAATILQLSLYSELLEKAQGCGAEWMWVIPPGIDFKGEKHRVTDYAAYFRYVKNRLEQAVQNCRNGTTYPEPVPHCDICRWFRQCDSHRRGDDHLSLVAGIRRQQRNQLERWDTETMAKLAVLPIPLKERPEHGSREAIERVREQARVQVQGRTENKLMHEPRFPVAEGMGFCRLPEPSAGDLFVDIEGDPFVGESGLQYLFGFAFKDMHDEMCYEARWALNREGEKKGFQWLVDEIVIRLTVNPRMHVYHFGAYEPAAFKRLMGMHATREDEVDRCLRAGTLVDLHQAFKQGLRASVEEYSLKKIELFYGFQRVIPLDQSRAAMRYLENRLELGRMEDELPDWVREAMQGYNRDDCLSAASLRDWLEAERGKLVESGTVLPRPPEKSGDPSEKLQEKLDKAAELTRRLCEHISPDPDKRSSEQSSQLLLAQLLSWHRREDKRAWQEGYRLAEMDDEDLLDERVALTKLRFIKRVEVGRQVPTDRYCYDPQKTNVRIGKDVYFGGIDQKIGEVVQIEPINGTVDIKKTKKTADFHPPAVFMWTRPLDADAQADSLYRIGEWVAAKGIDSPGCYRAGRDLLLRKPPALLNDEKLQALATEKPENTASRIALALAESVLAIQGPPGSGKTYTGARMVRELVKCGRKVGIAAFSHKAIHKFLKELQIEAGGFEAGVRCVRKVSEEDPDDELDGVELTTEPKVPLLRLRSGESQVAAGTPWLWARAEYLESVDTLFVDEAGQMSLADLLASAQCARNLVLLGDPQQLERPLKGSHPDGAEKSALEHLLNGQKTISAELGLLLPESWRLHPEVCKFTSPVFYEDKLKSHATAVSRVLEGHPWLNGAGLWFVPVKHEGCRNSSSEEVEIVSRIVEGLLKPDVKWLRGAGNSRCLRVDDILIVAPYNAQVADLSSRLPGMRIGTVDKFQGQEAPVVIYSLATSSPEDAPRGMEFLYSPNRFNVATSRAMTAVVVVANPKLFEPDCRTPRQMQLANAFCQFAEMARHWDTSNEREG
jgi:predicted RecB family nuclease